MKHFRLNNFILWCKNWYEPVNKNEDIFTQALNALKLDEYVLCEKRNVIGIVTNYIDELIDTKIIDNRPNYLRFHVWTQNIFHNMILYNVDYNYATLYTIRNFFAYHFDFNRDDIKLDPPVYSRKIYKLGFIPPKHFGNSYKLANYKANRFFNKNR